MSVSTQFLLLKSFEVKQSSSVYAVVDGADVGVEVCHAAFRMTQGPDLIIEVKFPSARVRVSPVVWPCLEGLLLMDSSREYNAAGDIKSFTASVMRE